MALRAARCLQQGHRSHLQGATWTTPAALARHFARASCAPPSPFTHPLDPSPFHSSDFLSLSPPQDPRHSARAEAPLGSNTSADVSSSYPQHVAQEDGSFHFFQSGMLEEASVRGPGGSCQVSTAYPGSGFSTGALLLESDSALPYTWLPGYGYESRRPATWSKGIGSSWSLIPLSEGVSAAAAALSAPGDTRMQGSGGFSSPGTREPSSAGSGTMEGPGSFFRSPYSTGQQPPPVRSLVITACGPDRPGLVSSLTKRVLDFGGNVEQSRMARLAGEFSVIMLVTVDGSVPQIPEQMRERLMEVNDLQITARWAKDEALPAKKPALKFRRIHLKGADNPGLVYNVTEYLAGNRINIENLETSVEEAPFGGTTLFTMEGVIAMPTSMPTQALVRSLDVLESALGVQIELRNMDPHNKAEDLRKWQVEQQEVGGASRYSIVAQREGAASSKWNKLI